MSTETKEPPATPTTIASYLTNAGETFDRMLSEDAFTRTCFVRYCFALLDKLGVLRHRLRELVSCESEALPDKHRPTADQAEQLLQSLGDAIKERHGRFYDVYDEHFLSMLQRYSYEWLSQNAGYDESQTLLRNATKAIPHQVRQLWDNPIRFSTDPVTGKCSGNFPFGASRRQFSEADAFVKAVAPSRRSPGRVGRPKGIQKPKQSGKAPLPHDEARAVFQAMEGDGKDWKYCARKILNKRIPLDHKERERLRAFVDRLKHKGSIL